MSVLDFMRSAARKATSRLKPELKYVGKSQVHSSCDRCGKTGLVETSVFERRDNTRVYLGSECAKGAGDMADLAGGQELLSEDSESLSLERYKAHDFKLSDQLLESAHVNLEGQVGGYKVYSVDGSIVRARIDIDFVAGGNGARYKYVPIDEIWVENLYQPVDFAATLLHEIVETDLMLKEGQSYDEAHETASRREAPLRRRMLELGEAVKSRREALELVEKELKVVFFEPELERLIKRGQLFQYRRSAGLPFIVNVETGVIRIGMTGHVELIQAIHWTGEVSSAYEGGIVIPSKSAVVFTSGTIRTVAVSRQQTVLKELEKALGMDLKIYDSSRPTSFSAGLLHGLAKEANWLLGKELVLWNT